MIKSFTRVVLFKNNKNKKNFFKKIIFLRKNKKALYEPKIIV